MGYKIIAIYLRPLPMEDDGRLVGTGGRSYPTDDGSADEVRWGKVVPRYRDGTLSGALAEFATNSVEGKRVGVVFGADDQFGPAANFGRGVDERVQHKTDQVEDFTRVIANYQGNKRTYEKNVFLAGVVDGKDLAGYAQYNAEAGTRNREALMKGTELYEARVYRVVRQVLETTGLVYLADGGHNLNRPMVQAVSDTYRGSRIIEIQVDFHGDCRVLEPEGEGKGYHSGNHIRSLLSENRLDELHAMMVRYRSNNAAVLTTFRDDSRVHFEGYTSDRLNTDALFLEKFGDVCRAIKRQETRAYVVAVTFCGDTINPNSHLTSSAGHPNEGLDPQTVKAAMMLAVRTLPVKAVQVAEFNKSLDPDGCTAIGEFHADVVEQLSRAITQRR